MKKIKTRDLVKETRTVFSKSIGVLFVYTAIFAILREFIFLPVSRKLWSLSLMTVDEGFISDQNITAVFTHPLVLLAGIFAVTGFCILSLWETAGIIMILEYAHRDKPVKLLDVVYKSPQQIKHCIKPKNWMIFVYLLIIQPITDSDFAGMMQSSLTMPEFIMDFIKARTMLYFLYAAILIILFVFFIRYLFLPQIMILEKKSFNEARKKSIGLMKGKLIVTYIQTLIVSIIGTILVVLVPFAIMVVLQMVLVFALNKYALSLEISLYVFEVLLAPLLGDMRDIFVKVFISAIILVLYHIMSEENGIENEVVLSDDLIKTEGKIRTFKSFIYLLYACIFIFFSGIFTILVISADNDPAVVLDIINPTKIAAHKGYSSIAPENTLPAFEKATDCEIVDYIELDVRETKDGVPVVIHDANLAAAAGNPVSIYDVTYDELQKISATYNFPDGFEGTTIPALEDVFKQYAGGKDFIVEIKHSDNTPELPKKIVDLMEEYNITDRSVIHSGSYKALKAVKELNPNIPCGLIIAVSTSGYADLPYADFFSVEHTYISNNMIRQIHNRGKKVYAWTVNDEKSFDQVRTMDVDAIITDYPEDAYDGIHLYDMDLINKISEYIGVDDFTDLQDITGMEGIDYNGSGD